MKKEDLLTIIKENGYSKFNSKQIQEIINKFFDVPKYITRNNIKQLLADGLIERKYTVSSCSTICASCIEYGCDAEPKPPISYYQIIK